MDELPSLRQLIRATGKTQAQVAEEIGTDPTYVSHMVNGKVNWVNSTYFPALVGALGLTMRQVEQIRPDAVTALARAAIETGRHLASDPNQSAVDLARMGATPMNREYPIPMLGDVAAGGRNTTFLTVENADEIVDAGRELAERYGISNLYALRVTGDSMYSERARFSVPDGSTLIVHRELEPVRGDIVVAYIEDLDLGVVKEYGEPEEVTLSSYNPTGPLYRANQHRIRICGVVVETRSKPRTRRNGTH